MHPAAEQLAAAHEKECEVLQGEVARMATPVGAGGDVVVNGLQAEIKLKKLKTSGLEKLHAE